MREYMGKEVTLHSLGGGIYRMQVPKKKHAEGFFLFHVRDLELEEKNG